MEIKELMDKLFSNPHISSFISDNKQLLKKILIIAAAAAILLLGFVSQKDDEQIESVQEGVVTEEMATGNVVVDIGGAVNNPKVIELEEGARIADAIEAAGGLTDEADLTEINRAAFVNDGDKIYIPSTLDTAGGGNESGSQIVSGASQGGKVNINTADSQELQTLTGIGPATAEKIIDYRTSNGRFKTIEDIKKVSGIGDKTFEKFKDNISV